MGMTFAEAQAAQQASEAADAAAPPADKPAKTGMTFAEAQAAQLASEGGPPEPAKPSLLAEAYNPILNAGTGAINALHSAANRVERGLGLDSAAADTAEQERRVAAQKAAEQASPSSAAPQIGDINSVEGAARWALSTTGSLGAALIQLTAMGIPRAAALAALQGFEETKTETGDTGRALLSAGVEAAGTAVPLHLLGNVAGGTLGKTALTAAGMGGTNVATEAAQRELQNRDGLTPGEAADAFARGAGMIGLHAGATRLINGKPVAPAAPPAPPEAPPAPPQLALPPPGTAPMTPEEIAIAQAKARATPSAPGRPPRDEVRPTAPAADPVAAATAASAAAAKASRFSPEGDTLNVTPPAMDANGNPVETGKPGTGGTAFRPDQLTPDELALVSKHFGDKTPAEIAGMVPDAQQRMLRVAQIQEEAQRKIDALGGIRVSDTSGEGPTSPPSRPNGAPDRPRGDQPTNEELEKGIFNPATGKYEPVDPYARSGTGTSDRPFRGDSTDSSSPDQQADFEQQARDQAEAQRKATVDDLMRRWQEQRQREEEAARSRQNAGSRPFADAEDRYADMPASRTAKGQDGDGNYHVDGDGFVISTKGGPIRFMSAKEAARWIIDQGHAKSASQVFEIVNHPGKAGGFTVRETMRTKPEAEQPGAAPPPNTKTGEPIPLTGPKNEPVKGTTEPPQPPAAAPAKATVTADGKGIKVTSPDGMVYRGENGVPFADAKQAEAYAAKRWPQTAPPEAAGKPAEPEKPAPAPEAAKAEQAPVAPAGDTGKAIPFRPLDTGKAFTPSGDQVDVHYGIVDADHLTASHNDDLSPNPAYPQDLQPRDRDTTQSALQVANIAQKMKPEMLGKSPNAGDGAPIISADGTVESGNGRTLGIKRAYDQNLPTADAYRQHLKDQGYPVDGIAKPMLVRIRTTPMDRAQRQAFTRDANERPTLGMTATEQAAADAKALPDHVLDLLNGSDVTQAQNSAFVRAFVDHVVAPNDQGKVYSGGRLSIEGRQRVENALIARAYGDSSIIEALAERTDENIKGIGAGLLDNAAAWAKLRAEAAREQIDPGADLTQDLVQAVNNVRKARRDGTPAGDMLKQQDFFDKTPPAVNTFMRMFYRNSEMTKPASGALISQRFAEMIDELRKSKAGGDLLGNKPTAAEIIAKKGEKYGRPDEGAAEGAQFRGSRGLSEGAAEDRQAGERSGLLPAGEEARGRGEEAPLAGVKLDGAGELPAGAAEPGTGSIGIKDPKTGKTGWVHYLGDQFKKFTNAHPDLSPHEAAQRWVAERGAATGHEHGVAIDANGNVVSAITSRASDHLIYSPELTKAFEDPNNKITFYHNHPRSTSLSYADIGGLGRPGMHVVVAIGRDGEISWAKMSDAAKPTLLAEGKVSFLQNMGRTLWKHLEDFARHEASKLGIGTKAHDDYVHIVDRNLSEVVAQSLARGEFIDYVGSRPLEGGTNDPATLKLYNQALVIVKMFRAELEANHGLPPAKETINADDDRPALPVRTEDGFARLHQENEKNRPAGSDASGQGHGTPPPASEGKAKPPIVGPDQVGVDKSGPWLGQNKGAQGRLLEQRDIFDKTDQGDQRVIPGAEKKTPEELAAIKAAADAKRQAELDALKRRSDKVLAERQMNNGKMQPKKPGAAPGLFDTTPTDRLLEPSARELPPLQTADAEKRIDAIGGKVDTRPPMEKLKASITGMVSGSFDKIYDGMVDRLGQLSRNERARVARGDYAGRPDLRDEDHGLRASVSAHKAGVFADRESSFSKENMTVGPSHYDGKGVQAKPVDFEGKPIGGFLDIFRPVAQLGPEGIRRFATYARIIRGTRLLAEGREKVVTAADAALKDELERMHPEFKTVQADIQRFNKTQVKFAVDSGRITKELGDEWTRHNDYSPFFREITEGHGVTGPTSLGDLINDKSFRKLKGGDSQIGDYLEVMARNIRATNGVGLRNIAAQRAMRDAVALGIAREVSGDPREMTKNAQIATIYVGGKPRHFQIDHTQAGELTWNALHGLDGSPLTTFARVVGLPANVLRWTTTHAPVFLGIRHPWRESMQGAIVGRQNIAPIYSAVKGQIDVLKNGASTRALKSLGVGPAYDVSGSPDNLAGFMRAQYAREQKTAMGQIRRIWHAYEKFSDAADLGTRTQIFSKENAAHGDQYDAAFAAINQGVNFKRRGGWPAMQLLSTAIPFLNARLQGLDVLGRAIRDRPGQTLTKMAMLAGLTSMYYAYNRNDPLYKQAGIDQRDNNFLFNIGGHAFPIGIPFEAGILAKVIPEHLMRRFIDGTDNNADVRGAIAKAIFDTMKFSPPAIVNPLIENATNHSFFTGQPVVPRSVQDNSPPKQYTATTSETAKAAAAGLHKIGIDYSPIKIDHALQGYFSTLGTYVTFATDALINGVNGKPGVAKPAKDWSDYPIFKQLFKSPQQLGNAQLDQLFEMRNDLGNIARDMTKAKGEHDSAEMRRITQEKAGILGVKGGVEATFKAIGVLNQQKQAIQSSGASGQQKSDQLAALEARKAQFLRKVTEMRRRAYGS